MIRTVLERKADGILFSHCRKDYDIIDGAIKNGLTPEECAQKWGRGKVLKGIVILLAANHMYFRHVHESMTHSDSQ